MRRLFDMDSPLMRLLGQVADLAVLNVLYVLLSLPVVTAGAAAAGLYRAALSLVREKGPAPWRLFLREFRDSFPHSTALWGILLAGLTLTVVDLGLFYALDFPGKAALIGLFLAVLAFWLVVASYVFPLTAQFDNTVKNTLKNAVLIGFAHPLRSLLIVALNILPWLMLLVSAKTFLRFLIFWLLLGFGVTAYVNSLLFAKIFAPYMEQG